MNPNKHQMRDQASSTMFALYLAAKRSNQPPSYCLEDKSAKFTPEKLFCTFLTKHTPLFTACPAVSSRRILRYRLFGERRDSTGGEWIYFIDTVGSC
jgi:hypothetical protein